MRGYQPKEGFFVLTTHLSFVLFWAGWIHDIYFSAPSCTWPVFTPFVDQELLLGDGEEEEEYVAVKINIDVMGGELVGNTYKTLEDSRI